MRDLRRGFMGELLRIFRSPLRIALALAPFLAWGTCLAVYAERTPRQLHVGVVDQDRTALSRAIVRDLSAAPALALRTYPDQESLHKALRSGTIRAGVVIPDGTDETVREGRTARVAMLRDATRTMPATQIFSAVSTVIATESARLSVARLMRAGLPASAAKEMAMPLRIDPRPLGNPWMDYLRSFSPVLLPMFLQLALMVAGASCATHLRRLRRQFQIGRLLAWVAPLSLVGAGFEFALADTTGGGIAAAWATIVLCVASGFIGLGLGRLLNDTQRTLQVLLVFNTPAFVLSGFSFPEWAMPRMFEILTRPLPYSLWLDFQLATSGAPDGHLVRGLLGLLGWALLGGSLCLPAHGMDKPSEESPVRLPRGLRFLAVRGLATLVFLGPPGYFAMYGSVYADKEESRVPVAVTGAAASARNIQLSRALSAHPRLDVRLLAEPEALRELETGDVRAVVSLQDDIDLRLHRRRTISVPVLFHADKFLTASDIQRAVSEVLGDASARIRAGILGYSQNLSQSRELANPLLLDDRTLGNPRETYGDYMLPLIGLLIAHQLLLVAMGLLAAARRHGEESIHIPGRQAAIVWLWFSAATVAWLVWGMRIFEVPTASIPVPAIAQILLSLLGAAGMGALIGRLCGEPVWVLRLAAFTSYPLFFLSGASWPLEAMPTPVRVAAWFDPLGPLLDGTDRALRLGATWSDIAPSLGHGAFLGAFWLALAWIGARWIRYREHGNIPREPPAPIP